MYVHVWEGFLISFDSWDILRSLLTQVTQVWPGMAWYSCSGKIGAMWQPWLKMFEGSHGSHGSPHSAMEWLGSALSPVSPDANRSDVPYGYGARRPGSSSFLVKNVEHPWPWWNFWRCLFDASWPNSVNVRLTLGTCVGAAWSSPAETRITSAFRCWLHCHDTPQKLQRYYNLMTILNYKLINHCSRFHTMSNKSSWICRFAIAKHGASLGIPAYPPLYDRFLFRKTHLNRSKKHKNHWILIRPFVIILFEQRPHCCGEFEYNGLGWRFAAELQP